MLSFLLSFFLLAIGAQAQTSTSAAATASATANSASNSQAATSNTSVSLTQSYPTATLLLQGSVTTGFLGAVVHVTSCATTYALTCTDTKECASLTATVTEGPFDYIFDYFTIASSTLIYLSESCSLQNVDNAICTAYASASYDGTTSTATTLTTVSGTQLKYAQVPITAGGGILASPGAAPCSVTGSASASGQPSATASTKSGGGGLSTGAKAGIGVGVGVGVPLIAALLGVMFFLGRRKRSSKDETHSSEAAPAVEKKESFRDDNPAPPYSPQQQQQQQPAAQEIGETRIPTQEMSAEQEATELSGASKTDGIGPIKRSQTSKTPDGINVTHELPADETMHEKP